VVWASGQGASNGGAPSWRVELIRPMTESATKARKGNRHMLFVVLFEDNPEVKGDVRKELMPIHQDFQEKSGVIRQAGPLRAADGTPAGGMWVVDTDSFDAVEKLIKADPFWPTGLRKSYRILSWTKMLEGGKRL
jgi:hypothetical protein